MFKSEAKPKGPHKPPQPGSLIQPKPKNLPPPQPPAPKK